jgi:putative restriction endonuclease
MKRRSWSHDELILAFNLYCKTPFGRMHGRNPEVIELARLIGRTPSAVSWKLVNFASLDPALKKRGISGASHGSIADLEVWDEFNRDWDRLAFESERLRAQLANHPLDPTSIGDFDLPLGAEREAMIRVRVNQSFFRSAVLAAYESKCCITGLAVPELLNASHIVPWTVDANNRVNPCNGLCLNALHDRMFDRGFLTVTAKYTVKVSKRLASAQKLGAIAESILAYDGRPIQLPDHFLPDPKFLDYHERKIFRN